MLTLEKRFNNMVYHFGKYEKYYKERIEEAREAAKTYNKEIKAFRIPKADGFDVNCKVKASGELVVIVKDAEEDEEIARYAEKLTEILKKLC